MTLAAPWYACPQCGNERGFRQQGGVRGTKRAVRFLDGAGGWWQQVYECTLGCPCGHSWWLLEIAERGEAVRYEMPPPPPPPPTPDEQRRIDRGARLRDRRVACHTGLLAAAEAVGLTPAQLSAIERGVSTDGDEPTLADLDAFYVGREAIPIERRDVLV